MFPFLSIPFSIFFIDLHDRCHVTWCLTLILWTHFGLTKSFSCVKVINTQWGNNLWLHQERRAWKVAGINSTAAPAVLMTLSTSGCGYGITGCCPGVRCYLPSSLNIRNFSSNSFIETVMYVRTHSVSHSLYAHPKFVNIMIYLAYVVPCHQFHLFCNKC